MWVVAESVWMSLSQSLCKSRLKAPPTFMSDGLYLTGVDYPDEFGVAKLPLPEWMDVSGNVFQTA